MGSVTVAGPEVLTMRELAAQWKSTLRRKGFILPVPLPGSFGSFLRAGKNLAPQHVTGVVTFRQWLLAR
jgi:hypothetical protein